VLTKTDVDRAVQTQLSNPDNFVVVPQPRQAEFHASSADIAIYGGAAGGGKTWSLLVEPLRHISNPGFGAVIFRRTIPEITHEGALWDEAGDIYPYLGGRPNENDKRYRFPAGSNISFSHMQREQDKEAWKSAQVPLLEFDQLETFTQSQFFYMLSRNRSMCGVKPYVRASANPEPGWLADFLAWWIDDEGWAIPERSGVIRWMVNENDQIHWADTPGELQEKFPGSLPKSVTFILSTVYDNEILLSKDPAYLANLQALPLVDRQRLLGDARRGGNWKIKPEAGLVFNRAWFEIVPAVPAGGRMVRFWDFAATKKSLGTTKKKDDPDYTASVKGKIVDGITYILDMSNERMSPAEANNAVFNTATQDNSGGLKVAVRFEQEGGASGVRDAYNVVTGMQGFDVMGIPVAGAGDKVLRAKPLASQAFAGNVKLLAGSWNEEFLAQLHNFPDPQYHDDIVDAASGCYNELVGPRVAGTFGR